LRRALRPGRHAQLRRPPERVRRTLASAKGHRLSLEDLVSAYRLSQPQAMNDLHDLVDACSPPDDDLVDLIEQAFLEGPIDGVT